MAENNPKIMRLGNKRGRYKEKKEGKRRKREKEEEEERGKKKRRKKKKRKGKEREGKRWWRSLVVMEVTGGGVLACWKKSRGSGEIRGRKWRREKNTLPIVSCFSVFSSLR